jgi:hypothetical protein
VQARHRGLQPRPQQRVAVGALHGVHQLGRQERVAGHVDLEAGSQQHVVGLQRRAVVQAHDHAVRRRLHPRHLAPHVQRHVSQALGQPVRAGRADASERDVLLAAARQPPEQVGDGGHPAGFEAADVGGGEHPRLEPVPPLGVGAHRRGQPHERRAASDHLRAGAGLTQQGGRLQRALAASDHHHPLAGESA